MKILVTGGAGFVGSHLVDAYISHGHEVTVVDNLFTGNIKNIPKKAKVYECDIQDRKKLLKIFEEVKPEVVSHHAAQVSVQTSLIAPNEDAHVNILGTLNVVEFAAKMHAKKIIYGSSGGAIYPDDLIKPARESDKVFPTQPYGISKYAGEMYVQFFCTSMCIPYVILRYSNIYGYRQKGDTKSGVVSIFLKRMIENKTLIIYGTGTSSRDYIYIKDVVRANLLASHSDYVGTLNISTGKETSLLDLIKILKVFNPSLEVEFRRARDLEKRRSILSNTEAKKHLGWEPEYGIKNGISEFFFELQKQL